MDLGTFSYDYISLRLQGRHNDARFADYLSINYK